MRPKESQIPHTKCTGWKNIWTHQIYCQPVYFSFQTSNFKPFETILKFREHGL
jgi:hypothetical protein